MCGVPYRHSPGHQHPVPVSPQVGESYVYIVSLITLPKISYHRISTRYPYLVLLLTDYIHLWCFRAIYPPYALFPTECSVECLNSPPVDYAPIPIPHILFPLIRASRGYSVRNRGILVYYPWCSSQIHLLSYTIYTIYIY